MRWLLGAFATGLVLYACSPPDDAEPDPCENSLSGRQARGGCSFHAGSRCDPGYRALPIQYVFVLMQENRSFDNYYGRFQAYLKDVVHRTNDVRLGMYVDQESPSGIDVPGTPYELRDACGKKQQDAVLDGGYDPRVDAPFNPDDPGKDPPDKQHKHYWHHAKGDLDQCVSDTCHEWWCSHLAWDSGRMDGFYAGNAGYYEGGEPKTNLLDGARAMLYYDQTDIPFYYWLADQFALGDHYFSSLLGPTWPNRDYLYGATSRGLVANGSEKYGGMFYENGQTAGSEKAVPDVSNGNDTIYDALVHGNVKYTQWVRNRYSNIVSVPRYGAWYGGNGIIAESKYTYDAGQFNGGEGFEKYVANEEARIRARLGSDDPSAIVPQDDPNTKSAQGSRVNFIDSSSLEDVNGEDEHPPGVPQMGQRFVYDVVRVLMANPEVWKRSVLFVTYDEAGGFYDHVDPPHACTPDNLDPNYKGGAYGNGQFGDQSDRRYGGHFDRYGVRVPLLVISPWVRHGYVSHYTYDHTSILHFIEAKFGLPALTRRDANADALLDFFDFSDAATKLATPYWGAASLPAEFPNTPSENLDSPSFVGADSIRLYGGANKYKATAPGACLAAYPPAKSPSEVENVLGSNVFDGYDWSAGKIPPQGYDAEVSQPFPLLPKDGMPPSCDGCPADVLAALKSTGAIGTLTGTTSGDAFSYASKMTLENPNPNCQANKCGYRITLATSEPVSGTAPVGTTELHVTTKLAAPPLQPGSTTTFKVWPYNDIGNGDIVYSGMLWECRVIHADGMQDSFLLPMEASGGGTLKLSLSDDCKTVSAVFDVDGVAVDSKDSKKIEHCPYKATFTGKVP